MKPKLLIVLAALLVRPIFAETQANNGIITDVIVYHGQALVTRTIELKTGGEDVELLIENLPERILPESLYAQGSGGIQVLSVRYREKTIAEDKRQEIEELEKQIQAIHRQLQQLEWERVNTEERKARYQEQWKLMEELNTDHPKDNIRQVTLRPEMVIQLASFLDEKSKELHTEITGIANKKLDTEEELKTLEEKLAKLREHRNRIFREALVYLHVPKVNSANVVHLSYLVNEADWSPQYNLKSNPEENQVRIEYNAVVHQSCGEDWTNAVLALSTAVPALVASPAELEPMKIGLISAEAKYRGRIIAGKDVQSSEMQQQAMPQGMPGMPQQGELYAYGNQTDQFGQLVESRRSTISKGIKAQRALNSIAISNQMLEFEADKRMLQQLQERAVAIRRTEGVSVMYTLPGKLTLPSKSDQQLVTIASLKTAAEFVFVAAPLLTDYVYLQADITNSSDTILLPGPADMFRNGQFVGKGDMKLVTIGQTFTTGFGVDSQIQVTREFKDKKTDSFLGNRVDENYYRLAIDNYYDKPVALRLFDRLPWTESEELAIELTGNSHPLSTDAEYVRTEKDKGILRWDMELKPNTAGQNATIVNYAFTLKYDNDMVIQTVN